MNKSMKLPIIGLIGVALMVIMPIAEAGKKHKKRIHKHGHHHVTTAQPADYAEPWRPGVSAYNYTSPNRRYHRYYASSHPYFGPYYHFYPRFRTYDNNFTMYTTGAHYPRFHWRPASYGNLPHGAILNSYWFGRPAYMCKLRYRSGVRYGRVGTRGCYFKYRGKLRLKKRYVVQVRG